MKRNVVSILLIIPTLILALDKAQFTPIPSYRTGSPNYFQENTDPVKICALRVSFPSDDNPATTGDGQFLLSSNTPCSSFVIDPPPHNSAYFRDHIRAVANYYNHVSHGHAIIDTENSEVFPLLDSLTFQVSDSMDYYHPFLEEDSIDARLVELFHEAVLLADSAVDFSKYDIVVIFHAGVGQDFSLFLDPTPYDIPSAFLNIKDFRQYIGNDDPTYQGIVVDGTTIDCGIILPETQNHLLYDNWEDVFGQSSTPCEYQIGLNGTFAFMMGFFWGLPSLYDTETGETGIGKFGLMDQGSSNLNGLFPAVPSAWERIKLGWEEPAVAAIEENIELSYVESGADTLVWKVPINDFEYFLIENRCAEFRPGVSFDSLQYRLYLESGEDDWPSIFPLIRDSLKARFSEETGVLLSVPRYDVGLPGSGLLIWHIDESVIQSNLADNRINVNKERRGVDLEEGDGAQDLGYESQMLFADPSIGWFFDPWFAGNEGFFHLNPDYPTDDEKRVGFTDFTNPSSKSNDYAHTGISIDSIGPAGKVMTFRIRRESSLHNFPISILSNLNISAPLPINLDFDDIKSEFIIVTDSIYLFDNDGYLIQYEALSNIYSLNNVFSPILSQYGNDNLVFALSENIDSSITIYCWTIGQDGSIGLVNSLSIDNTVLTSNLLGWGEEVFFGIRDLESNKSMVAKYSSFSNSLQIESLDDWASIKVNQLAGDKNNTYAITNEGIVLRITVSNDRIHVNYVGSDAIYLAENYGDIVVGYLDEGSDLDFVFSSEKGVILLKNTKEGSHIITGHAFDEYYHPIFSDINGDGKIEVLVVDSTRIYALTSQILMIHETNFPISIPNQYKDKYFDPHLLTNDVDGDGVLDIIAFIHDIGIVAFNKTGKLIDGFPIAFSNHIASTKTMINSSNGTKLIAVSDDGKRIIGTLISHESLSDDAWICLGSDPERSYFYDIEYNVPSSTSSSLLDKKRVFNWPNPVEGSTTYFRYFVNKQCNVSIDIYDLAGDFVKSLEPEENPIPDGCNDIKWYVSNVESGVYFAVVKATSGNTIDSKIVKVMIIK